MTAVIGRFSSYSGNYNFDASGNPIPWGEGILRDFATEEYEFYAQDTWRVRRDLTLTLGLRYSLNTPVYERNGLEVKPSPSLATFFDTREVWAAKGVPYNEPVIVDLAGPAHGRPGFYKLDKNNFAPRAAFAWTPTFENGLLKTIFGTGQRSVFRGGFSTAYDRIGSRLAVTFDLNNTLGFSSSQDIAANTYNVSDKPAPLFTSFGMDIRTMPGSKLTPPQNLTFPLMTPMDEDQRIESSLDDSIITPISHSWNFSISREIGRATTVEVSYIGRIARNLLLQRDVAQLNNLVDPKSGADWYSAMASLIAFRYQNAAITSVQKIPYFENLFPLLAGKYSVLGQTVDLSATQAAYRRIARASVGGRNTTDWTYVQQLWDDGLGFGDNLFFHPQYAALDVWSTMGYSDYHAATVSVRQRMSSFNMDLNYTLSKSTDNASALQGAGMWSSAGLILNALRPNDGHGISTFDLTHIVNANLLWELPFGRGRAYLNSVNPAVNAILGGWQFTNVFRWNSGLPVIAPIDSQVWATNWQVQSRLVRIRPIEASPTKSGTAPNFFTDPTYAYKSYRNPLPGEGGDRTTFRRNGYFSLDFGLGKSFTMPWSEGHRVQFRWEVFNATNTQILGSPRGGRSGFGAGQDPYLSTPSPDFGVITSIQGSPRIMQFALRYDF
jgi:hypothetical protein